MEWARLGRFQRFVFTVGEAYRFDELVEVYGNFPLQGRAYKTGKTMGLLLLPAHARPGSYAITNTYQRNSAFCRRKSLA